MKGSAVLWPTPDHGKIPYLSPVLKHRSLCSVQGQGMDKAGKGLERLQGGLQGLSGL